MTRRTLRRQAATIFRAALRAADPHDAVMRYLARRDYSRFRHVYVIGAGKAAASMAQAAERALGRLAASGGLVNVKYGHVAKLRRIELNECGHPLPDERGVAGAERIAAIASAAGEGDLVLCLISGGASALLPLPAPPVTLEEKQEVTRLLLACGATSTKSTRFASTSRPSRAATGAPGLAGKGGSAAGFRRDRRQPGRDRLRPPRPIHPPSSTQPPCSTGTAFARRFRRRSVPGSIKASPARLRKLRSRAIGSSRASATPWWAATAWRSMPRRATRGSLGFRTLVLSSSIAGETREIARMHAAIAREVAESGRPVKPPACIITGGETTVTLRGDGLGGRNQEFVLAAALDIAGLDNVVVFSAGTDGTDGPTDAAGAIADGDTLRRKPDARRYLDANDSYHYFESLGDLVITGPTNTNVADVRILLIGRSA
jgi:glycerate 2-kinase